MAFDYLERSPASGEPINLYLFRYGAAAGDVFAYTDAEQPVTHAAIVYEPVPIERDAIEASGTLDRSLLKISTDVGTGLAELFRVWPPSQVVTLIIREGHADDLAAEFPVIWAGRIVASGREGSQAHFSGEPISTSMQRTGLRRHYQIGCPHALYGDQCRADKASKTVSSVVSALATGGVILPEGWQGAFAKLKFRGGLFEWDNDDGRREVRTILDVDAATNTLRLTGVLTDLEAGTAVDVVLGCNHKPYAESDGDCQGLHDNILNYGGQDKIPTRNPIGVVNNYY